MDNLYSSDHKKPINPIDVPSTKSYAENYGYTTSPISQRSLSSSYQYQYQSNSKPLEPITLSSSTGNYGDIDRKLFSLSSNNNYSESYALKDYNLPLSSSIEIPPKNNIVPNINIDFEEYRRRAAMDYESSLRSPELKNRFAISASKPEDKPEATRALSPSYESKIEKTIGDVEPHSYRNFAITSPSETSAGYPKSLYTNTEQRTYTRPTEYYSEENQKLLRELQDCRKRMRTSEALITTLEAKVRELQNSQSDYNSIKLSLEVERAQVDNFKLRTSLHQNELKALQSMIQLKDHEINNLKSKLSQSKMTTGSDLDYSSMESPGTRIGYNENEEINRLKKEIEQLTGNKEKQNKLLEENQQLADTVANLKDHINKLEIEPIEKESPREDNPKSSSLRIQSTHHDEKHKSASVLREDHQSGPQIEKLNGEIKKLMTDLEKSASEKEDLNQKLQDFQSQTNKGNDEARKLKEDQENLLRQNKELMNELSNVKTDTGKLRSENEKMNLEFKSVKDELAASRLENQNLAMRNIELENQNKEKQHELDNLRNKNHEMHETSKESSNLLNLELSTYKDENLTLKRMIQDLKSANDNENHHLKNDLEDAKKRLVELESNNQKLHQECQGFHDEKENLAKTIDSLKVACSQLQSEKAELMTKNTHIEEDKDHLNSQLVELRNAISQAHLTKEDSLKDYKTLELLNTQLTSECEYLKKTIQTLEQDFHNKINESGHQMKNLQDDYEKLDTERNILHKNYEAIIEEKEKMTLEIKYLNEEKDRLMTVGVEKKDKELEITTLTGRNEALKEENRKIADENSSLRDKLEVTIGEKDQAILEKNHVLTDKQKLEDEVKAMIKNIADLESKIAKNEADKQLLEQDLKHNSIEKADIEAINKSIKSELESTKQDKERITNELKSLNSRIKEYESRQLQADEVKRDAENFKPQLANLNEVVLKLELKNQELMSLMDKIQSERDIALSEKKALQVKNDEMKKNLEKIESDKSKVSPSKQNNMQNQIKKLEEALKVANQRIETQENEFKNLQASKAELEESYNGLTQEKDNLSFECSNLKGEVKKLQDQLKSNNKEFELENAKTKLLEMEVLAQKYSEAEGEIGGLRNIILTKNDEIEGHKGKIREYEKKISSLYDQIDNLSATNKDQTQLLQSSASKTKKAEAQLRELNESASKLKHAITETEDLRKNLSIKEEETEKLKANLKKSQLRQSIVLILMILILIVSIIVVPHTCT